MSLLSIIYVLSVRLIWIDRGREIEGLIGTYVDTEIEREIDTEIDRYIDK